MKIKSQKPWARAHVYLSDVNKQLLESQLKAPLRKSWNFSFEMRENIFNRLNSLWALVP